jgi:hypothetical protein
MTGDERAMTEAEDDGAAPAEPDAPPLSPTRLMGALLLSCALFFVMLVVFSFAGLGPLGVAPALVVAVAFTGRLAHVRRLSALILIGALTFVIMVVLTYGIAVAVLLNNPQLSG